MQTALVEILINGEVLNTIVKPVTPAEALVLKSIHGHDCIARPVFNGEITRSNEEEADRLRKIYGDKTFRKVFPGALPRLPISLGEAGVAVEEAPVKTKKKAD